MSWSTVIKKTKAFAGLSVMVPVLKVCSGSLVSTTNTLYVDLWKCEKLSSGSEKVQLRLYNGTTTLLAQSLLFWQTSVHVSACFNSRAASALSLFQLSLFQLSLCTWESFVFHWVRYINVLARVSTLFYVSTEMLLLMLSASLSVLPGLWRDSRAGHRRTTGTNQPLGARTSEE